MAILHGKNVSLYLDDSTGACQSISGKSNNVVFTETVNNPEALGYGDPAMQRSASGIPDANMTYEAFADYATGKNLAVFPALKGLITRVQLGIGGSTSGGPKTTACMLIQDFAITGPVNGMVTVRASFALGSGSVTASTW